MIKYLAMDVDGTLTDGKINISNSGELYKSFNVKDGTAIKNLIKNYDVIPIVLTGRKSIIVETRCKELDIPYVFQGCENKLQCLKKIAFELKEVAYIGDDINDLEAILEINKNGGFTACPNDSCEIIKKNSKYVCIKNGGDGTIRELVDYLILNKYISKNE